MRIQGERPDNVGQTTATQATDRGRTAKAEQSTPSASTDRVNVSEQARLLSAAVQAAQAWLNTQTGRSSMFMLMRAAVYGSL